VPRSYPTIELFLGISLVLQALAFVSAFRNDLTTGLACTLIITLIPLTSSEFAWMGTEHASNPFVTVVLITSIYISRNGRFSPWQCILAGMFTCFAMNVRQTALMVALVPATVILCTPQPIIKKIAGAVWSIVGGIIGLAFILVWVWVISDIPAYLGKFYLHPAAYAGLGTWMDSWHLIGSIFFRPIGWLGAAAVILVLSNFKHWTRNVPLVLSVIISGLLSVALPHREYPHYWMGFIPNLALIAGVGLYPFHTRPRSIGLVASVAIVCLTAPGIIRWYGVSTGQDGWTSCNQVALEADKLAPVNSTLLVWGPILSEPVVFASRQPTANPNWILWMMEPPTDKLLPLSVSELYDQYLQNPPKEIVAYSKWMSMLTRGENEKPEIAAEFKLGRLLLDKYEYRFTERVNDYAIGLLVEPGNTATRKDQPNQK
jgi:hypothetical protein